MRDRPIHVTQTMRVQWQNRAGEKLPLDALLAGAAEVTDFSGYYSRPGNGAVLWENPAEPTCGFLVKRDHIKDVVIGIMNKRSPKPASRLELMVLDLQERNAALESRVARLERELDEMEVVDDNP